jgi:hypothetical protein
LVSGEARELLFGPALPRIVDILRSMESRGISVDYAEKPAPWVKLR